MSEICGDADLLYPTLDARVSVYTLTQPSVVAATEAAFASFDLPLERRQHLGGVLRGTLVVTDDNFIRFLLALTAIDACVFGGSVVPAAYVR